MVKSLSFVVTALLLAGCSRSVPPQASQSQSQPAPVSRVELTIPRGTTFRVRLNETLDTRRNRAGDRFTATLEAPIEVDGRAIVPGGTTFTGHVTGAKSSGRLRGRAFLGVTLDSFQLNGATHQIDTTADRRASGSHKKRNLVAIGGGSGVGALIGGLAGGGKGALIGAGAGAAAGTAGAAITGRKNVSLPVESRLSFTLREAIRI